jgi:hypothetical protein
MSIEKKSLISTLKTTKKANAVSSEIAKPSNVSSKAAIMKRQTVANTRMRRASGELHRASVVQPKASSVLTKRRK